MGKEILIAGNPPWSISIGHFSWGCTPFASPLRPREWNYSNGSAIRSVKVPEMAALCGTSSSLFPSPAAGIYIFEINPVMRAARKFSGEQ